MPQPRRISSNRPDVVKPDFERALRAIRRLTLPDPRIDEVATFIVQNTHTDASARNYAWGLAQILRWFAEHDVNILRATPDDIQRWWISVDWKASHTRYQLRLLIRAFFKVAVKRRYVRADPGEDLPRVRREALIETPALTDTQGRHLIASVAAELDHPDRALMARRDLAALAVMLRLCLRASEAASLRWKSLGTSRGRRVLNFMGKGRRPACLYLPDDVYDTLRFWRDAFEAQTGVRWTRNDPILVPLTPSAIRNAQGRRPGQVLDAITSNGLYIMVVGRLSDIGLDGDRFGPHCLRATGATLALEGNADLVQCQALLRHLSIDTTRKFYIKRVDPHAQPGMDAMGIRFG